MAYVASSALLPKALAGDVRAIARLLTRAENGTPESRPAFDTLFRNAGRAHIVGITGVPGSGKSTLVARLTAAIRAGGRKVAIVAVDPSSPFSGGAILGDRIRMGALGGDPGVFMRSMATHGALGGLARGTLEAVDVFDAAGYDVVLIETVGVGQDEVDVARAAHTTVVVSAPGLGDDIQAIKAGILEIADIHVVSKCDRADADKTIAELKNMLTLGLNGARGAWRPPIVPTSATRDEGVAELAAAIDRHRAALDASGEIDARRASINERRLLAAGEEILRDRFVRHRHGRLATLLEALARRALSPHSAATRLIAELGEDA
ncbi:MAG: methylmalonyl Co-A mutase-associated GTPase MeaB [Betaproteobacteria bacterium]